MACTSDSAKASAAVILPKPTPGGFSTLRIATAVAVASAAWFYAPTLSSLERMCPNLALGIIFGFLIKDYVIPSMLTFCYNGPRMSNRKKVMIATWEEPGLTGEIYTEMRIDMTEANKFMASSKDSAKKVTITHLVLKAIGNALKQVPSVNGRVVFGRYIPFDTVDVSCLVRLEEGKDLAMVRIPDADKKDVYEIGDILRKQAEKLYSGKDEDFNKAKGSLNLLSTGVLRKLLHTVGFLASGLGLNIDALGAKRFIFGGAIVSSVGSMGLDTVYIPFTPWARVPLMICVGQVKDQPVVEEDPKDPSKKTIVIRPILTLTATIDHRFLDGTQGAQLAAEVRKTFANPETKMCNGTAETSSQ